jgi:hypothetical protein
MLFISFRVSNPYPEGALAADFSRHSINNYMPNSYRTISEAYASVISQQSVPRTQNINSEESPEHENKMLKVARQLEPMANELFDIGSRINSGNANRGDGDLLIEYSTALEIMAGVITREYNNR